MNYFCRCEIVNRWYSNFILIMILLILFIQVFNNVNLIKFKSREVFLRPSRKILYNIRFLKIIFLPLSFHADFRLWVLLLNILDHEPIYNIFFLKTLPIIHWLWAFCVHWMTSFYIYLLIHNISLSSACIQLYIFFYYFFVLLHVLKQMSVHRKIVCTLWFQHGILQLF